MVNNLLTRRSEGTVVTLHTYYVMNCINNNCCHSRRSRRRRCTFHNYANILILLLVIQVDISYSLVQVLSTAQTALLLGTPLPSIVRPRPDASNNNKPSNVPSVQLATTSNRLVNGLYAPRDPSAIPIGFARMCNKAGGYAPRPIWEDMTNGLTPWFEQTQRTHQHHPGANADHHQQQQQQHPKMKRRKSTNSVGSINHGSSSGSSIVAAGDGACYIYYNTNECYWCIDDTFGYGIYIAKPTDSLLLPPLDGWVSLTGKRLGVSRMMFVVV